MAHKRLDLSPYNYCQLNPIIRTDPTGMVDGWYEGEDGDAHYNADVNSQADMDKLGIEGDYLFQEGYDNSNGSSTRLNADGSRDPINMNNEVSASGEGSRPHLQNYSASDLKLRLKYLDGNDPISRAVSSMENNGTYPNLSGSISISQRIPFDHWTPPELPDMVAVNVQGSCIVGGGGSLNLTFGFMHNRPFLAISPSIGAGFDVSVNGGITWGDYKGHGVPLPKSLSGPFMYEDFGVGGLNTTFTQDLMRRGGRVRAGEMWTTTSVNLNIGSKTFVGGSTGSGLTWTF
jgi:hypothetical protein